MLFIRPGGIGDAALLIPAISALKKRYSAASVDVLAEKRNAGAFSLSQDISTVFCYDKPEGLPEVFRRRYDVVIDTEQWHRLSAVVARLSRGGVSIGFGTNERQRLFHHAIPYCQDSYEAMSFFDLLSPFEIDRPQVLPVPFLFVPQRARKKVAHLLSAVESPYVVLFPGATIPERRWGRNRFRDLATLLRGEHLTVVVVGGGDDVADGEAIINGCNGLNLAGKTLMTETAAVLERSALLVTGDSGIMHLAVGLDKPTVSLFGPGIAKKWAPRGDKHIVINKNLPCSPCTKFGYTPKCKIKAKCMSDITVDEVFDAVMTLLKRQGIDVSGNSTAADNSP